MPSDAKDIQLMELKDEGKPALIPHSYVSSGLTAHVMYANFLNTMPFYRQEKDFETQIFMCR